MSHKTLSPNAVRGEKEMREMEEMKEGRRRSDLLKF